MSELHDQISAILRKSSADSKSLKQALQLILAAFKSETGTIHLLNREQQMLHLVAESGLPPAMLEVVKTIPVGKGIAGQTVARGGPVTVCNLQTDQSGVARPGARKTGVGGALCVPLRAGNVITGTLGIGTIRPYQYTAEETRALEEISGMIGARLEAGSGD